MRWDVWTLASPTRELGELKEALNVAIITRATIYLLPLSFRHLWALQYPSFYPHNQVQDCRKHEYTCPLVSVLIAQYFQYYTLSQQA